MCVCIDLRYSSLNDLQENYRRYATQSLRRDIEQELEETEGAFDLKGIKDNVVHGGLSLTDDAKYSVSAEAALAATFQSTTLSSPPTIVGPDRESYAVRPSTSFPPSSVAAAAAAAGVVAGFDAESPYGDIIAPDDTGSPFKRQQKLSSGDTSAPVTAMRVDVPYDLDWMEKHIIHLTEHIMKTETLIEECELRETNGKVCLILKTMENSLSTLFVFLYICRFFVLPSTRRTRNGRLFPSICSFKCWH